MMEPPISNACREVYYSGGLEVRALKVGLHLSRITQVLDVVVEKDDHFDDL